jgi:MraZ protein
VRRDLAAAGVGEAGKAAGRAQHLDEAVEKYLNLTSYYGQQVEMDSQGRVVLPQKLRDKGKLDAEVVVLGKLVYLEVQNEKEFEGRLRL